jgi:hypothetical protein
MSLHAIDLLIIGAYVVATTRAGLVFHAADHLGVVDRGYSEPVDNTQLVTARLSFGDRFVLALPHERSGHMAGGVYAFRRGVVGDTRLRRGPSGGLRAIEMHPRTGTLVGATFHGAVYTLQQPLFTHWPGPMFPPRFQLHLVNREYFSPPPSLPL